MKVFMVLAALAAVAFAQYDYTGPKRENGGAQPVYGPPQREFEEPQAQQPEPSVPEQEGEQQAEAYTPQVFKHVYIHAAEDEPVDEQARVIKVPGGDKHVNIIFVKTPSQSSSAQTDVILPEPDQHKNLVYVLLKKNTAENNIRIRKPPTQGPQKPEVYFIRYKDQEQQQQNGASGGYSQGPQNGNGNGNGNGHHSNGNGNGNGHHSNGNGNGNGHHSNGNGNGNGHHSNGNGNGNNGHSNGFHGASGAAAPPPPPHSSGNGNGNGYSEAGRYVPAVAPGPIRSPSDVPSSGYGVPL